MAVKKPVTLDGTEFLTAAFTLHILPAGLSKSAGLVFTTTPQSETSLYGFPRKRSLTLMTLLKQQKLPETNVERFARLNGVNLCLCPVCKTGRMVTIRELPRIRRAPRQCLIWHKHCKRHETQLICANCANGKYACQGTETVWNGWVVKYPAFINRQEKHKNLQYVKERLNYFSSKILKTVIKYIALNPVGEINMTIAGAARRSESYLLAFRIFLIVSYIIPIFLSFHFSIMDIFLSASINEYFPLYFNYGGVSNR